MSNFGIRMERCVAKNKYWFALVTALNYGGSIACLDILHDDSISGSLPRHPKLLFHYFNRQKPFLYNLLKHGVITLREFDLMINRDEESHSALFELGLTIALLQGLVLTEPENGWMDVDPEDSSLAAMVVELRKFKDKVNALNVGEPLEDTAFNTLWDELSEILHSLYFDTTLLHRLYPRCKPSDLQVTSYLRIYSLAYEKSKHTYLVKLMDETKVMYERQAENIDTVMTVMQSHAIVKAYKEVTNLRTVLHKMYTQYEDLTNTKKGAKDASKLLHTCNRIKLSIELNDASLDRIMNKYNHKLDVQEGLKEQERRMSLTEIYTLKKSAMVGWLRRNTLARPPSASTFSKELRKSDIQPFQNTNDTFSVKKSSRRNIISPDHQEQQTQDLYEQPLVHKSNGVVEPDYQPIAIRQPPPTGPQESHYQPITPIRTENPVRSDAPTNLPTGSTASYFDFDASINTKIKESYASSEYNVLPGGTPKSPFITSVTTNPLFYNENNNETENSSLFNVSNKRNTFSTFLPTTQRNDGLLKADDDGVSGFLESGHDDVAFKSNDNVEFRAAEKIVSLKVEDISDNEVDTIADREGDGEQSENEFFEGLERQLYAGRPKRIPLENLFFAENKTGKNTEF